MTFTKQMRNNILRICRNFGSSSQKEKTIEELNELIETFEDKKEAHERLNYFVCELNAKEVKE